MLLSNARAHAHVHTLGVTVNSHRTLRFPILAVHCCRFYFIMFVHKYMENNFNQNAVLLMYDAMAFGWWWWWKDEQSDLASRNCCILKLNRTWYATQHDVINAQSHL